MRTDSALALGTVVCLALACVSTRNTSEENVVKAGDRVLVLRGPHAGRHGTITIVAGENLAYDKFFNLRSGDLRVGLDGEPGQISTVPGVVARGGRGGVSVTVHETDVSSEP